jgi:aldose 1-epimerase
MNFGDGAERLFKLMWKRSEGSMSSKTTYSWRRERDESFGIEFVVLRRSGGGLKELEAWIVPGRGSNLCRLRVEGESVIDFEPELLTCGDFTGTPVLYPTPNRVRNAVFKYKGRAYSQAKRGEPVFEHGLVHSEAWQESEPSIRSDSVVLETWIDFDEGGPLFEAFPFAHRLGLSFTLDARGIAVSYCIENRGGEAIPYGFGLHPYFMKLSGEAGTSIAIPVDYLMDASSDLLPTGRLIETAGTQFDVKRPTPIGDLDFDHVFTGIVPGAMAAVLYPDRGFEVVLDASEDFTHMVVYSPRGKGYFCVESQTCSTDAHNLYDRGFVAQSGLKFAAPGAATRGSVAYRIVGL